MIALLRKYCFLFCTLSLLLFASCGRGGYKLYAISGEITLDGKPLPNAFIECTPAVGTNGRPASGKSDDQGRFRFTTVELNDGITAGDFKVTVTAFAPVPAPDRQFANGFEQMQWEREHPSPPPASLVHENYTKVDKTPLTVKVPGGDFKFNLKQDGT